MVRPNLRYVLSALAVRRNSQRATGAKDVSSTETTLRSRSPELFGWGSPWRRALPFKGQKRQPQGLKRGGPEEPFGKNIPTLAASRVAFSALKSPEFQAF
jgi:hypothetical protein